MKKQFLIFLGAVCLFFAALALPGCTAPQEAESAEIEPAQIDVPDDVITTRDIAVEFVRQAAAICVPPAGATWQASKPANTATEGAHVYRFVNGDCTVSVAFPDPAPADITYYVSLRNAGTDFCWQALIANSGEILSTGYETVELEAENPATAFCEAEGYKYDIITKADGEPCGACLFDDGTACNAWDYLYGTCSPGDNPLP